MMMMMETYLQYLQSLSRVLPHTHIGTPLLKAREDVQGTCNSWWDATFSPYGPQWPYWDPWAAYRQQFSRPPTLSHQDDKETQASPFQLQEETFDQEARTDSLRSSFSVSSSPNEAVMPSLSIADDFQQVQVFIRQVANFLQIPLDKVKESQHKLGYSSLLRYHLE